MSNILIIEDDAPLSNGIKLALQQDDFLFSQAFTLESARKLMETIEFDLLLLDANLPDGNGFDFLKELRKSSKIPVIMLTIHDMETDIVTGLELGANDYVTKPFSLMVLRARVNTQLKNNTGFLEQKTIIDDFMFDFDKMEFRKNGFIIELSKTEQKLLKIFVNNKGYTLTREILLDKIWSEDAAFVDENALSVTVKRLRDKLEDTPSKPKYIKTVYGIGYVWTSR
ncbi:response regulator [Anaerocolumna sedimenticola]|uniref:Stage 0 sporulation protein A homolog n=1 Tax=Anaerocolumna sedimenticola TaxID=2696063 RepID=A0A6P1TRG9_9FIRM|nr:response regulator transcription factor [Anaerocolumna sedimenticola]QHQ63534.1 response regulator [Anaerocolumna sedimenticola]